MERMAQQEFAKLLSERFQQFDVVLARESDELHRMVGSEFRRLHDEIRQLRSENEKLIAIYEEDVQRIPSTLSTSSRKGLKKKPLEVEDEYAAIMVSHDSGSNAGESGQETVKADSRTLSHQHTARGHLALALPEDDLVAEHDEQLKTSEEAGLGPQPPDGHVPEMSATLSDEPQQMWQQQPSNRRLSDIGVDRQMVKPKARASTLETSLGRLSENSPKLGKKKPRARPEATSVAAEPDMPNSLTRSSMKNGSKSKKHDRVSIFTDQDETFSARGEDDSEDSGDHFRVHERFLNLHKKPETNKRSSSTGTHLRRMPTEQFKDDQPLIDTEGKSQQSVFEQRCVQLPGSPLVVLVEFLATVLVVADIVYLPLQVVSNDVFHSYQQINQVASPFWILEIILRFCTGFVDEEGNTEMRLSSIAKQYASDKLIIDVPIIIIEWGTLLSYVADPSSQATSFVLVVQFAKLLRLIRVLENSEFVARFFFLHVQSEEVAIMFGLSKIVLGLLTLLHFMACVWYGIGLSHENTWLDGAQLRHDSWWTQYVTAFHWSVGQLSGDSVLSPQNSLERSISAISLLLAFIVSAAVVSQFTTLMTRLQLLAAKSAHQMSVLQLYLKDKGVSTTLASRILDHAAFTLQELKECPREEDVEVLKHISQPLLVELSYEGYGQLLMKHPFFRAYAATNRAAMRCVCHTALSTMTASSGDIVFTAGATEQDPKMYFISKGSLKYWKPGKDPTKMFAGAWLNEAVLWTDWQSVGSAEATEPSKIICVHSENFQVACRRFKSCEYQVAKYGREFVNYLNAERQVDLSDNFDSIDLEELAVDCFGVTARESFRESIARTSQAFRGSVFYGHPGARGSLLKQTVSRGSAFRTSTASSSVVPG